MKAEYTTAPHLYVLRSDRLTSHLTGGVHIRLLGRAPVPRRIPLSCSMTTAINGFTELEILSQWDKPPAAVPEQSESDLQHPLAHPPELHY